MVSPDEVYGSGPSVGERAARVLENLAPAARRRLAADSAPGPVRRSSGLVRSRVRDQRALAVGPMQVEHPAVVDGPGRRRLDRGQELALLLHHALPGARLPRRGRGPDGQANALARIGRPEVVAPGVADDRAVLEREGEGGAEDRAHDGMP